MALGKNAYISKRNTYTSSLYPTDSCYEEGREDCLHHQEVFKPFFFLQVIFLFFLIRESRQ